MIKRGGSVMEKIDQELDIVDRDKELARLRLALHDAIRRPMGVIPSSAEKWVDQSMLDEAEERRVSWE